MDAERIAVFPGSFDPPTLGHLNIIVRSAPLFDRLVVGVLENPDKQATLAVETRIRLLETELKSKGLSRVEVRGFSGLTVHFAESLGAGWIVRGLRSGLDLEEEWPMALTNRSFASSKVETLFLPAAAELSHIRSRLVRQVATGGGDLSSFVTPAVEKALRDTLGGMTKK